MPNIPANAPSLCLHPLAAAGFFSPEAGRRKPAFYWLRWSPIRKAGDRLTAARLRTLWSLALWNSGKTAAARTTFQPVLQLAEQQHLKGLFLDAGDTLQPLLIGMNESSSACTEEGIVHEPRADKRAPADRTPFNSGSPDIHGELSERELQILQLIAEGQMNKEIARSLAISAETVKWHIKNIYAKLKVNSRTQAMSRALEMKLLD